MNLYMQNEFSKIKFKVIFKVKVNIWVKVEIWVKVKI